MNLAKEVKKRIEAKPQQTEASGVTLKASNGTANSGGKKGGCCG